jgi:hypothetical protein
VGDVQSSEHSCSDVWLCGDDADGAADATHLRRYQQRCFCCSTICERGVGSERRRPANPIVRVCSFPIATATATAAVIADAIAVAFLLTAAASTDVSTDCATTVSTITTERPDAGPTTSGSACTTSASITIAAAVATVVAPVQDGVHDSPIRWCSNGGCG